MGFRVEIEEGYTDSCFSESYILGGLNKNTTNKYIHHTVKGGCGWTSQVETILMVDDVTHFILYCENTIVCIYVHSQLI